MKKLLILLLLSSELLAINAVAEVKSPVATIDKTPVTAPSAAKASGSAVLLNSEASSQNTPAQIDDTKELATEESQAVKSQYSNFGVGVNVGTLGIGIDISHPLYKDYLGLRFNANYFSYNSSIQSNPYAINLNSYGLLLDYMPFSNNIRLSGGFYYNNNNLKIKPADTVQFNGVTYNTTQFSNLSGSVTFPAIAPYVGIGYGSKSAYAQSRGGFYVAGDIGVIFSSPIINLNATCNPGVGVDCTLFNNNLQAQRNSIQNIINSYAQIYPVINFGVGYRF